jgi:sugar lactone lactonase YvrE
MVAGGKRWGNDLSHLNFPSGIYVDDDETVYIADYSNNRILAWKSGEKNAQVIAGEGEPSGRSERLRNPKDVILDKADDSFIISDEGNRRVVRWPRQQDGIVQTLIPDVDPAGLAIDSDGYLYVCGFKSHDVKRYKIGDITGTVVAGGHGKGCRLNQLSSPTCIYVDKEHSVYVSDWANHRIVKWVKDAKKGVIVAGGQNQHTDPMALTDPFGLIVDSLGTIYVADWLKHRVMRYVGGDKRGTMIIGEGGSGRGPNQLNHPMCIAFDQRGNLYVSDFSNHRVQKYNIQSNAITHSNGTTE